MIISGSKCEKCDRFALVEYKGGFYCGDHTPSMWPEFLMSVVLCVLLTIHIIYLKLLEK